MNLFDTQVVFVIIHVNNIISVFWLQKFFLVCFLIWHCFKYTFMNVLIFFPQSDLKTLVDIFYYTIVSSMDNKTIRFVLNQLFNFLNVLHCTILVECFLQLKTRWMFCTGEKLLNVLRSWILVKCFVWSDTFWMLREDKN